MVAEASNGEEAIEKALETSPDVVVMDVNMPVMDGIKATQKLLKKCRIYGLLPFLFMIMKM